MRTTRIVAVTHSEFKELVLEKIRGLYRGWDNNERECIDVKRFYKKEDIINMRFAK